jgi:TRAP transporter TAXI family solute receptor
MRAGLGLALALTTACAPRPAVAPAISLRIATGPEGGTYLRLGQALARIYHEKLGLMAVAEPTDGSIGNLHALEEGRADLAFTQADVAYDMQGKASRVRALAALDTGALQLVTRADGRIRRIADLAGRRVGIGPKSSGTERAAEILMTAYGLSGRVDRQRMTFEEATARVTAGEIDAAFVMAAFPTDVLTRTRGLRLVPVEAAMMSRIRGLHPFYRPIVIPRGTYADQAEDVLALGVENMLACRAGLDDARVESLTRVLLESLRELGEVHPSARTIDPEEAAAVPIPLHPGAKRCYRIRELFR